MRYAWLSHPATVFAALLLLLNDHLLKQAWPGLVTGKLSDVAGLVVAAPLASLLFLRKADLAATLLTGALFAAVKSTETGAEAASQAWTLIAGPSRVLADPTDLLALPALALAWWIRKRSLSGASRRWQVLLAMPLTVVAVGATSGIPGTPSAEVARIDGNRLVVSGIWASDNVSTDGGVTWMVDTTTRQEPVASGQTAMCAPLQPSRCYRVVANRLMVMQSDDGGHTWAPSWEVSPGRTEWLTRALDGPGRDRPVRSATLVVQTRPGGHVVVVANAGYGVAVRAVGGTWQRLGYASDGRLSANAAVSLSSSNSYVSDELRVAVLAGLWFLIAGLTLAAPTARVSGGGKVLMAFGLLGVLCFMPWRFEEHLYQHPLFDGNPLVQGLVWVVGAGVTITVVTTVAMTAARERIGSHAWWHVAATCVLVALGVALPFSGWDRGWPDSYGTALAMAAFFGLSIGAIGLTFVRRNARVRSAELAYLAGSSTSSPR